MTEPTPTPPDTRSPADSAGPPKRRYPWAKRWYWRLRDRMIPGLLNSQYVYFKQLDETLQPDDRWLDIGCGRRIVLRWVPDALEREGRLLDRASEVVGVDPDADALKDNRLPITKHHAGAESVPEPDNSFDLITANMVAEHLADPESVLKEVRRLLKPGGTFMFHTPNFWYPLVTLTSLVPFYIKRGIAAVLERRATVDVYPTLYRLNSTNSITRHARAAGLEVERIDHQEDSPQLVQLGPLVVLELLLIRLVRWCPGMKCNLIVKLRKPEGAAGMGADA